MELTDKVILVTGAAGGMGREIVLKLVREGAKVVAADLNEAGLEQTKNLASPLQDNVACVKLDITDRQLIAEKKDGITNVFGHLDGVINNAGIIQKFCHVADMSVKDVERVMNINFYGTYNIVSAFLPVLQQRPEVYIVNVCSMGAFLPVPGQSIYGASKAAVRAMTEGLMAELHRSNVHVMEVFPGAIKTDIKAHSGIVDNETAENTKRKITLPSEAAAKIVDAIKDNKRKLLIGKDCWLMDKLCRINIFAAIALISKAMKGRHGM